MPKVCHANIMPKKPYARTVPVQTINFVDK